jgi:hypothetical protein
LKNNKSLNNEINRICESIVKTDNTNIIEKENKMLKDKLESIDKKFDIIIKENNNIKSLIEIKTRNFSKIQTELETFKKNFNEFNNKKQKNNPIKSKKKMSELLRMGKNA